MASGFPTLGSSGDDVKTLQRLLKNAGYDIAEDGVYGSETLGALKKYQSSQGIAGSGYTSKYVSQLDDLLNKYVNRAPFNYDPTGDDTYKRLRDQYLYMGERAMKDTYGAAANMTGGQPNSFAHSAGQQAYQEHAAQVAEIIPELYELALSKYKIEGDDMYDAIRALKSADDAEYDKYTDEYAAYIKALGLLKSGSKGGRSSGGGAKTAEEAAPEAVGSANQLSNILTESEFKRRKAQNAASLAQYPNYATYKAAMSAKYA